jgi:hypothetical protein
MTPQNVYDFVEGFKANGYGCFMSRYLCALRGYVLGTGAQTAASLLLVYGLSGCTPTPPPFTTTVTIDDFEQTSVRGKGMMTIMCGYDFVRFVSPSGIVTSLPISGPVNMIGEEFQLEGLDGQQFNPLEIGIWKIETNDDTGNLVSSPFEVLDTPFIDFEVTDTEVILNLVNVTSTVIGQADIDVPTMGGDTLLFDEIKLGPLRRRYVNCTINSVSQPYPDGTYTITGFTDSNGDPYPPVTFTKF